MPLDTVSISAPHIEPPMDAFQATVVDIHGDLETVTSFATSAVGASQIVQFFLPDRMLVSMTRLPGARFSSGCSTPFPHAVNDCLDPDGGAMIKLAYHTSGGGSHE